MGFIFSKYKLLTVQRGGNFFNVVIEGSVTAWLIKHDRVVVRGCWRASKADYEALNKKAGSND